MPCSILQHCSRTKTIVSSPHILVNMTQFLNLALSLALTFLVGQATCEIWQNKEFLNPVNIAYQKIPPPNVTAVKLTKYFLPRYVEKVVEEPWKNHAISDIPYDVIFLVDSSWSIRRGPFYKGMRALRQLMSKGRPDTRYAAIKFSDNAKVQFSFMDGKQAKRWMYRIRYHPGHTNTQAALRLCAEQFFLNYRSSGVRKVSYKRVLILTDGSSNVNKEETLFNAFKLKELGAEIFVIAVGKYLKGISEIVGMASSTDHHLYRVRDMGLLLKIVTLIPKWVEPSTTPNSPTRATQDVLQAHLT